MKIEKLVHKYNIKVDARLIKRNDLFICALGNYDKKKYIDSVKKKCSMIISDENSHNPELLLYELLDLKYHYPLCKKKLIGITGTDGKTTCATILRYMLKGASIGTNGLEFQKKHFDTSNTTPDLVTLFKYFSLITKKKLSNIIMEVSSESYLTKRIPYLFFNVGVFLNISKEHLDKHSSFDNYLTCKKELLQNSKIKIINRDSKYYKEIIKNLSNYLTFGRKESDLQLIRYSLSFEKTKFTIRYKKKEYNIESPLLGLFNIYSLMAAILCMLSLNYQMDDIIKRMSLIKNIPGRMEKIAFLDKHLMIDYAHTIDSTKNILLFLKKYCPKKIITVVGCAGGRYREKRPLIGKIVLKYSSIVIFTMDDPRNESPLNIIHEMIGQSKKKNYLIEINRKIAINKALDIANDNYLVLILGKGRDNYLIINNHKVPYSDMDVIKEYYEKSVKK